MITVHRAAATDLPKVTDTLASAFAYDPLFQWMTGASEHTSVEPTLQVLFRAMAKLDLADARGHGILTAGGHRISPVTDSRTHR